MRAVEDAVYPESILLDTDVCVASFITRHMVTMVPIFGLPPWGAREQWDSRRKLAPSPLSPDHRHGNFRT